MEDGFGCRLRAEQNALIYEPSFAQYMISLYHFQQRYGLLKGETPVYTPIAYPRLQHAMSYQTDGYGYTNGIHQGKESL